MLNSLITGMQNVVTGLFILLIVLVFIYFAARFGSWGWLVSKSQFKQLEKEEINGKK